MIEQKTKIGFDVSGATATAETKGLGGAVEETRPTEEMTKLIAKGGGIAFAGFIFRRTANLLFQILLTRVLGVAAYGIYTLGYSVMSITGYVSMLGLPNASLRFGAIYHATGDNDRLKGCFLLVLFWAAMIAVPTTILLFVFSQALAVNFFKESQLAGVLRGFALAIPFFAVFTVSAASLRGLKEIKYSIAISEVFPSVGNLLLVGIAFLLGLRLMGAVYGFVFASVLTAGVGLFYLWRTSAPLVSQAKPVYEAKKVLGYSLIVSLADLSYLLLSQTDRIMLGHSTTAQNVGIYSVAALIASQLPIFLLSIDGIFSPVMADLYSRNRLEQLNSLFKVTAKWTLSLTLPAFMILILFPNIIQLFGARFVAGWPVLAVLSAAHLLHIGTGSAKTVLIMCGRQRLELYNSIVLASLNVILNILLIPVYGILGAAVATGISICLVSLTQLVEVYICFKMHPYKRSLLKPIASGLIAVVLWWLLNLIIPFDGFTWIAGIGIFIAFYLTALWLLGFDREDKTVLRALKRRLLQN